MSIICGVCAVTPDAPIPAGWVSALRAGISRAGAGTLSEFSAPGVFLLQLDLGAFPGAGCQRDGGDRVTLVSGDPVLAGRSLDQHRGHDLEALANAPPESLRALLRSARGNYNLARYERTRHRLLLATDRLGARPVYWARFGDFLVFAGVRRLFCDLTGVSLAADITGVVEKVAFGMSLGERTEFAGVSSLQGGKWIELHSGGVRVERYWDWCRDAGPPEPESPGLRRELFEAFQTAIRLRLGRAGAAFSSLSGGLDSRCVATVLAAEKVELHTVNSSWSGSMDQLVAREYAAAIGSRHHEQELTDEEAGLEMVHRCWGLMRENAEAVEARGGFPKQLWGGNDGSISVGYVYVSPQAVTALRAGDLRGAARAFLDAVSVAVSPRPFGGAWGPWAAALPVESITRELEALDCTDPGQRLFLCLLVNHQRRLLSDLLEDVDLVPCEHVEPFLDASFLEVACRLPVDASLGHALYHRWLAEFPPVTASVAWQAYPGHEPCPLPPPVEATSQWAVGLARRAEARTRAALKDLESALADPALPGSVLSRRKLMLLRVAQRSGLLDFGWALGQAAAVAKSLQRCGGRIAAAVPPAPERTGCA